MLAPLEPALLRALQQDGTCRALYGVLMVMHVALARHGEGPVAEATPGLFAALPRLMAAYVILSDGGQPANQPVPVHADPGGMGVDTLPRLLGIAPALLAPLLICLADTAPVHEGGAPGASGTGNSRVTILAPAIKALAAAHCLQSIVAAENLRLAVIAEEASVMRLLDALANVPDDQAAAGTSASLRTLCDALCKTAQDVFGRGL